MSRRTDHWATRSANNPQGRFCGFHIVFIVGCQPTAEPNVRSADRQITHRYPRPLEGIKHSTKRFLVLRMGPRRLLLSPRLCYTLLPSCFTCYHLTRALCTSSEARVSLPRAVTPNLLAAWLPVWRQEAGVLWLEDHRASERRSPSELSCLCRRRRENLRFHFQSLSSLCNRRERLSHPRNTSTPVQYKYVCLVHVTCSCMSPAGWVRSLFLLLWGMQASCCCVEVSLGRKAVWVHTCMD